MTSAARARRTVDLRVGLVESKSPTTAVEKLRTQTSRSAIFLVVLPALDTAPSQTVRCRFAILTSKRDAFMDWDNLEPTSMFLRSSRFCQSRWQVGRHELLVNVGEGIRFGFGKRQPGLKSGRVPGLKQEACGNCVSDLALSRHIRKRNTISQSLLH
jgi:hypothetical protein